MLNCCLQTDTSSLVYEIERDYVYEDFYEDKDLFDISDYPKNSEFFYPVNKNLIAKMKNEFREEVISEFECKRIC